MKKIFAFLTAISIAAGLFAQTPAKMTYQALIHNDGELVSTQIDVRISILQGENASTASEVYSETLTPTPNQNGLLSIEFGGETGWNAINWSEGTYFIKTEIDLTGSGSDYTITGISQLLSVPYAFHAKTAETITNIRLTGSEIAFVGWDKNANDDFSGNYNDLSNLPDLSGYLAAEQDGDDTNELQVLNISRDTVYLSNGGFVKLPYFSGSYDDLTDLPANLDTDSTDDFSGNYEDLINLPTIPSESLATSTALEDSTAPLKVYVEGLRADIEEIKILLDGLLPTVSTNMLTNTNPTSATSGGNISDDGRSSVIARGVCWSTEPEPTIDDIKTSDGAGTGSFTSNLSGLTAGTTYYLRAYATNSEGTAYGDQEEFILEARKPMVSTNPLTNTNPTSATSGGNISDDGGSSVTERGVCWSTEPEPTIDDSKTSDGAGTGSFTSNLSGLTVETTYYLRAYATNSEGTAYGNEEIFTSAYETFTDSRDNKTYKIIEIGDQTWMAENLAYEIPEEEITDDTAWRDNTSNDAWCYYDNNKADNGKYGVLYQWEAANEACPDGWHLPTDAEWTELENYLADNGYNYDGTRGGGGDKIGKALASASGDWQASSDVGNIGNNQGSSNNRSGFSALPGGYRNSGSGSFGSIGSNGYWWSSSEYYRYMNYGSSNVNRRISYKSSGRSVRCKKDSRPQGLSTTTVTNTIPTIATSGGSISDDGGSPVTERGVCWSTDPNPTVSDSKTSDGAGKGSFTSYLSGLTESTEYYVRAYSVNSEGVAYGNEEMFTTTAYETFTDSRDDKTYKIIDIGNGTWMAENLAYEIPEKEITDNRDWDNNTSYDAWSYYDNNKVDNGKYGVLYQWEAAKKACPSGWHLPSNNEWTELENYLADNGYNYDGTRGGGRGKIGKALASASGVWVGSSEVGDVGNNQARNNRSGFSALPGGYRLYNGPFSDLGNLGYWWSSTESESISSSAWARFLGSYGSSVTNTSVSLSKGAGRSIRCKKDSQVLSTTTVTNTIPTSATSGGDISDDGGIQITERGVCWSTDPNPTVSDRKTSDGAGTGSFTSYLSRLTESTEYYVRAYAVNSAGIAAYGNEEIFITTAYETFTDSRDNKTYKIIDIGNRTWMAENLAYEIPEKEIADSAAWRDNPSKDAWCYMDNDKVSNGGKYGVLYQWEAANEACPDGWHLPSDNEWTELVNYLIENGYNYDRTTSDNKIAKALASASGDWGGSPNVGAVGKDQDSNNRTGFSALPGGSRVSNGSFNSAGRNGNWWSRTVDGSGSRFRNLNSRNANVRSYHNSNKRNGLSVRCKKDSQEPQGLSTTTVTNTIPTSATSGGNISDDGGRPVIERGVCWSTDPNPTTADSKTSDGEGTGIFTSYLGGLTESTEYYVRAYAVNSRGTAYGNQEIFTTTAYDTFTDSRDDKIYKIIDIGNRTWMAENLAYEIPEKEIADDNAAWRDNTSNDAWCYMDNDKVSNGGKYGVLYQWEAAKEACPDGWHLPTDEEWTELVNYLIENGYNYDRTTSDNKIGKALASASGVWEASSEVGDIGNNQAGNNRTGFSALSGGSRNNDGSFGFGGYYGYWWSSTEYYDVNVWGHRLDYSSADMSRSNFYNKRSGRSVRCKKDSQEPQVLSTRTVINTIPTSATSGGDISDDGGSSITERGVCWSTDPNPTTADSKTSDGAGTGSFTSYLSGLTESTRYYFRAYAVNSVGTAYGNEEMFTTTAYDTFTDSRDDKTYKIIDLGDQTWMAENLAYEIPEKEITDSRAWENNTSYDAWSYYGNNEVANGKYGVLYQWEAAREACPDGWHLPTDEEWTELENYLANNGYNYDGTTGGGRDKIAKALASASGVWQASSEVEVGDVGNNQGSSNNRSGFSALPGGYRGDVYGGFYNIRSFGLWWSSSESSSESSASSAWRRSMGHSSSNVYRGSRSKALGFSVRCVRD